jgi:hypothetical protein
MEIHFNKLLVKGNERLNFDKITTKEVNFIKIYPDLNEIEIEDKFVNKEEIL